MRRARGGRGGGRVGRGGGQQAGPAGGRGHDGNLEGGGRGVVIGGGGGGQQAGPAGGRGGDGNRGGGGRGVFIGGGGGGQQAGPAGGRGREGNLEGGGRDVVGGGGQQAGPAGGRGREGNRGGGGRGVVIGGGGGVGDGARGAQNEVGRGGGGRQGGRAGGRGRGLNEGNRGGGGRGVVIGGGGGGQQAGGDGGPEVPILEGLPLDEMGGRVCYLKVLSDYTDDGCRLWIKKYKELIEEFRAAIAPQKFYEEGDGEMLNITIISAGVEDELQHVVLYSDEGHWVVLMFRVSDLYSIGFKNSHGSFQFSDVEDNFNFNLLRFESNYGDLQRVSNSSMYSIRLGMIRLQQVLETLEQFTPPVEGNVPIIKDNQIAAELLVCVLIFAESSRFSHIFDYMVDNFDNFAYFSMLPYHDFYIKDWSKLSKVLIAAHERPSMIGIIDEAIAGGLYGLGEGGQGFILPNGQRATNIGHVQSVLRVISRQTVEDSLRLFHIQG